MELPTKQPKPVRLPNLKVRIIVLIFSPPDRRSETLGDLIENYNYEINNGGKHAKRKADEWAKAEAEEIMKNTPNRYSWYAYRVAKVAGWVIKLGRIWP
jgi:hypothetical protein